MLATLSASECT